MTQKEANVISSDSQPAINPDSKFNILLQNDEFIAIDKPPGILVHRTGISTDRVFVLQRLRHQVQKYLYTVHRLDRATSGVLLFAFNQHTQKLLAQQFENRSVNKTYQALVRGWTDEQGTINHPVPDDKGRKREAITSYRQIQKYQLFDKVGRYDSARYTLLELKPLTGRKHQLRRHMRHIAHPIIGDVNYGDRHHNHYFWEQLNTRRLMLHACQLSFTNPSNGKQLTINCSPSQQWVELLQRFDHV